MVTPGIIDEKVAISAYDAHWPELFKAEALQVHNVLSAFEFTLEHIGSTAVTGLSAKPVIDMMLGIKSWELFSEIQPGLKSIGYEYLGEAGIPGREYFRKRSVHAFNVHVMLIEGKLWRNNLLLRNHLRSQPEAAKKYAHIKAEAITKGIDTLIAYSEHKSRFIATLLQEAQISATKQPLP